MIIVLILIIILITIFFKIYLDEKSFKNLKKERMGKERIENERNEKEFMKFLDEIF
jgi:hypothetical protein